jgi:hypothetical protein
MIQGGKRREFAMGQAVSVRTDYTAGEVRRFAKQAKDAAQARRLLAIAAVLDGASRGDAAKIGGMDRQTLRDWVIRFNEQGPDGLVNIPSPGAPLSGVCRSDISGGSHRALYLLAGRRRAARRIKQRQGNKATANQSPLLKLCLRRVRIPKNVCASAIGLCKDPIIMQSRKPSNSDF